MNIIDKTGDKTAITELLYNYILSIDSQNNDQFADNFSDNGVYDSRWGNAQGRGAIIGNIVYWDNSGITKGKHRFMGAMRISDLNEAMAKMESNYRIAEAETAPGIVATGFHTVTLEKINGSWKIARRKQTVDPSFKMNG